MAYQLILNSRIFDDPAQFFRNPIISDQESRHWHVWRVDSSVAAWMLKEQGFEVIGLFMKNWEDDDNDEYCSARQDWLDVVSVADMIGIDVEAVNFAAEYRERVFADFYANTLRGERPIPMFYAMPKLSSKHFWITP